MRAKDALYDFTESLITGSAGADPLYGAESFRSLRGPINSAARVVRIEILDGVPAFTDEAHRKELQVRWTAQFWVRPASTSLTDLDEATDTSYEMMRQFFDALCENTGLDSQVCDAYGDIFETGQANINSTVMAVTYLDGMINRAS